MLILEKVNIIDGTHITQVSARQQTSRKQRWPNASWPWMHITEKFQHGKPDNTMPGGSSGVRVRKLRQRVQLHQVDYIHQTSEGHCTHQKHRCVSSHACVLQLRSTFLLALF